MFDKYVLNAKVSCLLFEGNCSEVVCEGKEL